VEGSTGYKKRVVQNRFSEVKKKRWDFANAF